MQIYSGGQYNLCDVSGEIPLIGIKIKLIYLTQVRYDKRIV